MPLTPEQIAQINQRIPGFAGMPPHIQEQMLARLAPQQSQPTPTLPGQIKSIGLPIAGQAGLNAILSSGASAAAPAVPTGLAIKGVTTVPAGTGAAAKAAPAASSGLGGLAAIAAGAHTGNQQFEGAKKMFSDDKKLSLQEKAALALPTFGASLFSDQIQSVFGGGKDKDQKGRDTYRDALRKAGIYDDKFNLTLSDGTKVNMGLDGSIKNYNVNFDEKGIGDIVALANPFAYLVTGGDKKRASDLAGELTNAIKGTKNPAAEIKSLFERAGLYKEDALARVDQLKVDDQTKNVFKSTINQLGIPSAQQQGQPQGTQGMPGFNLVIQRPVAPKQPNPANAMRTSILQGMLADTQKPIQYPSQNPNYKRYSFNDTLNKIMGG